MLIDAETQLAGFDAQEELLPMSAHVVQSDSSLKTASHVYHDRASGRSGTSAGGRTGGRGRGRPRVQCQLCGKNGHLVVDCWYRFDQSFTGRSAKELKQVDSSNHLYDLWHRRLGHPAHATLEQICKLIDVNCEQKINENCIACHMGKSHKLPSRIQLSYYVSFVDAFTRHTWLYLLKVSLRLHRPSSYSAVRCNAIWVESPAVQSDWGGEYRRLCVCLQKLVYLIVLPAHTRQSEWSWSANTAMWLPTRVLAGKSPSSVCSTRRLNMARLKYWMSMLPPPKTVQTCLDVKFDEWCFPFAQHSSTERLGSGLADLSADASGHGSAQSSDVHESADTSVGPGAGEVDLEVQPSTDKEQAMWLNDTWSLVPLPADRSVVGCKWLFKIKRNSDGTVHRYKARLVAKGFTQVPGFDFEHVQPVVKFSTVYVLLALAVARDWALRQVDVNNAFLNGDLSEVKALYGLRQAPRNWNDKLKACFLELGFVESKADVSLFVRVQDDCSTYALVYVDDIIITGTSGSAIDQVVQLLSLRFSIKDLGELSYFLGIEVKKIGAGLLLSQRAYICELLKKTNMSQATSVCTPMVATKIDGQPSDLMSNAREYRSIVGALLYVCHTRPDIAFAVNKAAQFMQSPRTSHLAAVKRILRYLAVIVDPCLDSVFLGECLVAWNSKKQKTVSRSTMEAEYRSVAESAAEVTWLTALLYDLGLSLQEAPVIWCDNTSAVALSVNPVCHARSKHVELDVHFIREKIAAGALRVSYVPAEFQIADGLTKPLTKAAFEQFRGKLQMVMHVASHHREAVRKRFRVKMPLFLVSCLVGAASPKLRDEVLQLGDKIGDLIICDAGYT
ncbi:hypothetical protein F3Y22_tig00002237pilonHSYRG00052 [Hibiscus syriacus]|uniref:CCHC-type domain-containing protein n=1 Tax=Hibiscus syriacus TaxID=106335 RepID=A0A6A3CY69_HIBSY|nr:hypothetical protein F3Y22_tig00002237pilonHSYRG00052 [Hibiscus syriacus]